MAECNHPIATQYNEDGSTYQGAHPLVVDKRDYGGEYVAESLAAYPGRLSKKLGDIIFKELRRRRHRPKDAGIGEYPQL